MFNCQNWIFLDNFKIAIMFLYIGLLDNTVISVTELLNLIPYLPNISEETRISKFKKALYNYELAELHENRICHSFTNIGRRYLLNISPHSNSP